MHQSQSPGGSRAGPEPSAATRTARVLAAEHRITFVAHLLDDLVAVPGTKSRIGLDPLIGLIPVLGDLVTGGISVWVVLEAARFRIPRVVLLRMILNAAVDFGIGLVPVLGDVFDFGFKGNTRNLGLFHRYALDPGADTSGHTAFIAGLVFAFLGIAWISLILLGRLLGLVL